MNIEQLISHLNKLTEKHGNINVIGVAPYFDPRYEINENSVSFLEKSEYVPESAIYIGPEFRIQNKISASVV